MSNSTLTESNTEQAPLTIIPVKVTIHLPGDFSRDTADVCQDVDAVHFANGILDYNASVWRREQRQAYELSHL